MTTYSPALAGAFDAVEEHTFVRHADGTLISQTSSRRIIADLLQRLDIEPGMRLLEIGTGSAYSTALLAHLVGRDGQIISLDVVADLVDRARVLLPEHGFPNTTVLRADGRSGAPEHGPFDRIIAWATASYLPTAWATQITLDGVIVAPLSLAPISKSGVGARIRLLGDATPQVDRLFPAGFVEMHGQELDQWLIPPYGIDVLRRGEAGNAWWLSAPWLRTPRHYLVGQRLLDDLVTDHQTIPGPLGAHEDAVGFRAWLLATRPQGLTSAALGDPTWRVGHACPAGAALTDARSATETITAGKPEATEALLRWADTWRNAGRPGLVDLDPQLNAFHDGWTLSATVDAPIA